MLVASNVVTSLSTIHRLIDVFVKRPPATNLCYKRVTFWKIWRFPLPAKNICPARSWRRRIRSRTTAYEWTPPCRTALGRSRQIHTCRLPRQPWRQSWWRRSWSRRGEGKGGQRPSRRRWQSLPSPRQLTRKPEKLIYWVCILPMLGTYHMTPYCEQQFIKPRS